MITLPKLVSINQVHEQANVLPQMFGCPDGGWREWRISLPVFGVVSQFTRVTQHISAGQKPELVAVFASNCNPTHSRPEFASQIPWKAAVTSWLKSRSTQEPWKPRKFESSYRFWIHIDTSFSGCKDKLQTTSQARQRVVRLSHFLTKY